MDIQPHQADEPFVRVSGSASRRVSLDQIAICRIGRGPQNDIVLTDGASSREHATIQRDREGACILTDAGSRNGTLVNGRPVTAPTRLNDGDVITIGHAELHFFDPRSLLILANAADPALPASDATMFVPQQSLVTVLVIDVRGFTGLSRAIGAERLSEVMTTIFREAGALLARSGCWSEKFIGDAVLAIWKIPGNCLRASDVVVVLETVIALDRLFAGIEARFALPQPLAFGAAINAGPAALGNMGSGSTADFTALGDTVNKTFRLEAVSRLLATDLVLDEDLVNTVAHNVAADLLPPLAEATLKGFQGPQPVRLLRFTEIEEFAARLRG